MSRRQRVRSKQGAGRAAASRLGGATGSDAAAPRFGRDLWRGLFVIAVVVVLKIGLEQTPTGEYLHRATDDWLQFRLASVPHAETPVVLDISDLPGGSSEADPTPRADLKELVAAVAAQSPRAIGLDLDFSPAPGDPDILQRQDRDFLSTCLDLETRYRVPIFVGVERSLDRPPDQWLGGARYQSLAAHIVAPGSREAGLKAEPGSDSMVRASLSLQHEGAPEACPSLAAALAGAVLETPRAAAGARAASPAVVRVRYPSREPAAALAPFLRWSSERRFEAWRSREFLVNYGPLGEIEATARQLKTDDRDQVTAHGAEFYHKLVVIGRVERPFEDLYGVPGRHGSVAGALIQACAAYTLDRAPLYELTALGRLALDAGLSLAILALITSVRFFFYRRGALRVREHRLQRLTTTAVLLGILAGITALVRRWGLMWDDFLFVIGALLAHGPVEEAMGAIGRWCGTNLPRVCLALVAPDPRESRE